MIHNIAKKIKYAIHMSGVTDRYFLPKGEMIEVDGYYGKKSSWNTAKFITPDLLKAKLWSKKEQAEYFITSTDGGRFKDLNKIVVEVEIVLQTKT
jgi:hypothetical protein